MFSSDVEFWGPESEAATLLMQRTEEMELKLQNYDFDTAAPQSFAECAMGLAAVTLMYSGPVGHLPYRVDLGVSICQLHE
jgi:hypothetical protein